MDSAMRLPAKMNRLKSDPQRELNLAGGSGANRADRGGGVYRGKDAAEDSLFAGKIGRDVGLWQSVLRVVEEVEEFRPEVKRYPFGHGDVFADSEIHLPRTGAASQVAGSVAECARGGRNKGSRIDPLTNGSATGRD